MTSDKPWPVQAAKAKLSEILRRARAGKPQIIGTTEPCVVVSADEWRRVSGAKETLGRWLVATAPRGAPLDLPERKGSRRGDPFAGIES